MVSLSSLTPVGCTPPNSRRKVRDIALSKFIFDDKYSVTLEISDWSTTAARMTLTQKEEYRRWWVAVRFRVAIFEYLYAKEGTGKGKIDKRERKKQVIWRSHNAIVLRVIPFHGRSDLSRTLRKLSNLNDYGKTSAKEISNQTIEKYLICNSNRDNAKSTRNSLGLIFDIDMRMIRE